MRETNFLIEIVKEDGERIRVSCMKRSPEKAIDFAFNEARINGNIKEYDKFKECAVYRRMFYIKDGKVEL